MDRTDMNLVFKLIYIIPVILLGEKKISWDYHNYGILYLNMKYYCIILYSIVRKVNYKFPCVTYYIYLRLTSNAKER